MLQGLKLTQYSRCEEQHGFCSGHRKGLYSQKGIETISQNIDGHDRPGSVMGRAAGAASSGAKGKVKNEGTMAG